MGSGREGGKEGRKERIFMMMGIFSDIAIFK